MVKPSRPRRRAARTRTPAGDVGQGIIGDGLSRVEPLAVPAREAARLCGWSLRSWRSADARGLVPASVRLGSRRKVWPIEELRVWLAAGAPPRERWESMRDAREVRP